MRDVLEGGEQSVTLVRDHDKGTDLRAGPDGEQFLDPSGRAYRLVRRLV